jgi:hypothetical protein
MVGGQFRSHRHRIDGRSRGKVFLIGVALTVVLAGAAVLRK